MDAELAPLVRAWLMRAQNDLANAQLVVEQRPDLLDTAAYHCQQSAEKAMKAFLSSQNLSVPKPHDVGRLVQLASAHASGFSALQDQADALTPLATQFRYPSDDTAPMPSSEEVAEALTQARQIYDFVLSSLPPDAHPSQI